MFEQFVTIAGILNVLIYSNNIIVLTSDNEKGVPAKIKSMCRIRRAGTKKWGLENIRRMAPRSQEAKNIDKSIYIWSLLLS